MALVNRVVKVLKAAPKKIKQGLKLLLMTPIIILQGFQRLGQIIYGVGSRLKIRPIDDLSGKLLAAAEVLFFINLLVGVIYLIGRYRGPEFLVGLARSVVIYPLSAFIMVVIGFLITFPLDQRGIIRAVVVQSGVRQLSRTSAGLISVLISVPTTLFVTYLVGNRLFAPEAGPRSLFVSTDGLRTPYTLELGIRPVGLVFVVAFVISTGLVYWLLTRQRTHYTRTTLSVVEMDDSAGTQVLRVRNDSDERIDLSGAKIEDSLGEQYTLDRDITLRSGETITMTLPQQFTLETTKIEAPTGVSLLYPDKRVTSIYAVSGEIFLLQWSEEADIE